MNYQYIRVEKGSPKVGAEISGVNLAGDMPPDVIREIRHALVENGVVGFRDQKLSVDAQISFAQNFGKLYVHPIADQATRRPEVLPIHADENSTSAPGEAWHTDASCDLEPPLGSILALQEVPPVGGDTLFTSMFAAYDALSDAMKSFLQGLTALHDGGQQFRKRYWNNPNGVRTKFVEKDYPTNEHPVVCTHPENGRKYLYVNSMYTTRIVQLTETESAAVLQFIYRHVETPEFQYRFKWRRDSVLFWDNRSVQHKAIFDYFPHRRSGTRVQICGSRPRAF
ncbi:MAG: TauD/TfdA dioxygenase family protein [Reyranellaceae bacterium]